MSGPRRPIRACRPHGPRGLHEISVALLAAGHETGWWDENGVPAPWPRDFHKPDSGWRPSRPANELINLDRHRNGGEPLF